jgi:hypothetical protein
VCRSRRTLPELVGGFSSSGAALVFAVAPDLRTPKKIVAHASP